MNILIAILKFLFVFRPRIHAQDEAAYSALAAHQFKWWLVTRIMALALVIGGILVWVTR